MLLCVLGLIDAIELSWIDLLLALAPLVIVPLGLPLVAPPHRPPDAAATAHRLAGAAQLPAAVVAVVALLLSSGALAGALTAPWLGASLAAAAGGLLSLLARPLEVTALLRAGAVVFWVVGSAWLLISRLGLRPLDFESAIVELTAVHFHYGGFAGAAVTLCAYEALRRTRPRAIALVAAGMLAGPPLTAAGFTFSGALQIAGAAVLTLALWALAALTLELVAGRRYDRVTRGLLAASSLVVFAPMALAVQWAAGQHLDVPALSIPDMAAIHGTANALGFTLLALLGWRRARMVPEEAFPAGEHKSSDHATRASLAPRA